MIGCITDTSKIKETFFIIHNIRLYRNIACENSRFSSLFEAANGDKEEIRTERLVGGVSNPNFRDTERRSLKMFNAASKGSPNVSYSR